MSGLTGFKSGNHPQQTGKNGARDELDDRGTDPALFAELSERFGGFTTDVAASAVNKKCALYLDRELDGLHTSWSRWGKRVWCNPPYSDIGAWVHKAWVEWATGRLDLIVMLLPASRCEQAWWQDLVEPYRDRVGFPLKVEFLRGRRRFVRAGATEIGPNERPPFGSCLLIWGPV